LNRLRTLIFGKGYNKRNKNKSAEEEASNDSNSVELSGVESSMPEDKLSASSKDNLPDSSAQVDEESHSKSTDLTEKGPKKGHGRMPHDIYQDCTEIRLLLNLTVGDNCPSLCGGKLGPYQAGVIIRIKGQNFADVYRYSVEKLRCNLCSLIVSADIPPEVGTSKYDAAF